MGFYFLGFYCIREAAHPVIVSEMQYILAVHFRMIYVRSNSVCMRARRPLKGEQRVQDRP